MFHHFLTHLSKIAVWVVPHSRFHGNEELESENILDSSDFLNNLWIVKVVVLIISLVNIVSLVE